MLCEGCEHDRFPDYSRKALKRRKLSRRRQNRSQLLRLEHSNSGKKVSIRFDSRYRIDFFRFDSIRQSDKFAASTLIFK